MNVRVVHFLLNFLQGRVASVAFGKTVLASLEASSGVEAIFSFISFFFSFSCSMENSSSLLNIVEGLLNLDTF